MPHDPDPSPVIPSSVQPSVDQALTQRVAHLAKLSMNEMAVIKMVEDLKTVIGYVDQLNQVEIEESVEPFFGAANVATSGQTASIRSDEVQPSFDRNVILENAPDSDGESYQVPPVF